MAKDTVCNGGSYPNEFCDKIRDCEGPELCEICEEPFVCIETRRECERCEEEILICEGCIREYGKEVSLDFAHDLLCPECKEECKKAQKDDCKHFTSCKIECADCKEGYEPEDV